MLIAPFNDELLRKLSYWYELYDLSGKLLTKIERDKIIQICVEKFTGIMHGAGTEENRIWYYENGRVHRVNGPAYIHKKNGIYQWQLNGRIHRLGGPAHIEVNRKQSYYLFDKPATKEEHDLLYSITRLKGY